MARPAYVRQVSEGAWMVDVWVQPGARADRAEGLRDGRLKVRLMAPPVEGKANKAVVAFVAGLLGVRPRQVRLEAGHKDRRKTLLVESDTEPAWPSG